MTPGQQCAQLTHAAGESAAEWSFRRAAEHVAEHLLASGPEETPLSRDQVRDSLDGLVCWGPKSSWAQLPEDTHAVVLTVEGEEELLRVSTMLNDESIPHRLIREPDAPFNGAATALGILPLPRERVRRLLAKYPLLR